MNRAQMRALAAQCRDDVLSGAAEPALARLMPVVEARTSFPLLDLAGSIIGEAGGSRPTDFRTLLDRLAATGEIGAWPLISSALASTYLPDDVAVAFGEARRYVLLADVWHATDAIGERVLGEGLRSQFDVAFALLDAWSKERSVWLRRAVGVAVHLYAKRERDKPELVSQLLDLLAPLLEERDTAAVKGIGWGLKTIGKYYPEVLTDWLGHQIVGRRPRKLMLRKVVTYLPDGIRSEFV